MTNESLNQILTKVNQLFYSAENYALRSVDNNIDVININATECIDKNKQEFYDLILIKNNDTKSDIKYVGIVLDMIDDLHFYILPDFRGEGYLQASLNTSILPFLSFYKERVTQRLSFKDIKIKEYFIRQFDFKSTGDYEVEKNLNSNDVKLYDPKNEKSIELSDNLKDKMINYLTDAILKIRMLNRQINYTRYDTFDYEKSYLNDLYLEIKDDITSH